MKSYYNIPGIEEMESHTLGSAANIEEIASQMQATAGLIADGTLGAAADSHADSAHTANMISQKLHEVQTLVQQTSCQAKESSIANDSSGAQTLGWGG